MPETPSLFLPETLLAAQVGVGVYIYDLETRIAERLPNYQPAPQALHYYQVQEILGEGSWWVPTAIISQQPSSWPQPVVPLSAWGRGIPTQLAGENVMRPEQLAWWIEARTLPFMAVQPGTNQGLLQGTFPRRVPYQRPESTNC